MKDPNDRHVDPVFQQKPDNAHRRTAQGKRILGSRRLLINQPETNQRVNLVRQSQSNAHRRGRTTILRPLRRVMFRDSIRDSIVFSVVARVITAHDSLQFGELPDHAC